MLFAQELLDGLQGINHEILDARKNLCRGIGAWALLKSQFYLKFCIL
jgi:hypothetical protein